MKLWTHHPAAFDLRDPNLQVDWTQGTFWNSLTARRYRELLPMFHAHASERNLLWCCSRRGEFSPVRETDCIEWEIDVPFEHVIFFDNRYYIDELLNGDWTTVDQERLFKRPATEAEGRQTVPLDYGGQRRPVYGVLCKLPVTNPVFYGKMIPTNGRPLADRDYLAYSKICDATNATLPGGLT